MGHLDDFSRRQPLQANEGGSSGTDLGPGSRSVAGRGGGMGRDSRGLFLAQDHPDPGQELGRGKRLGDEVADESDFSLGRICEAAHEQDRRLCAGFPDSAREVDAGNRRHDHVREDQVDALVRLVEGAECFQAVVSHHDIEAGCLEDMGKRLPNLVMIVDKEDPLSTSAVTVANPGSLGSDVLGICLLYTSAAAAE